LFSNANTAPHLLDFKREYLREDELALYKVDAWKEHCRLDNEAILEPRNWLEKQNNSSPSSINLPEEKKIAQRIGLLQQEFPMLCRTGIITANEIIVCSMKKNHVDFIYLGIFPRSLDRTIEDWTRDRVSIAMLKRKIG